MSKGTGLQKSERDTADAIRRLTQRLSRGEIGREEYDRLVAAVQTAGGF